MNGATIPTSGVALPATTANATAAFDKFSETNNLRLSAACGKLAMCAQSNNPIDSNYFLNLCVSLSRGIDFAIVNNQVPPQASNLPKICKLVCQRRTDSNLQAAIMVLMITIKHACNAQWFSTEDTQDLLALVEEVARIFNTHEGVSTDQTNISPTISQIMSRYYPWLKLNHVLAYADIKPGFEACAMDFHISKNMSSLKEKRVQLLVAMKDNIETSSCIITPQKVNFMINGKGILGRMVGYTELGPQLPTVVNPMLRFGPNLLQAIGHFDAHYIVLIALMGDVPSSSLPVPEDYAQPATATVQSDAEIVEGPSRISLNCPISFTRIKRPAKGKLCKHLQCFDLSNYLEMNSRCPSWRCPHCNQPICYPDIRIDKQMSKILQEVGESVVNVIIHSDGSWEATSVNDDSKDEPNPKPAEALQEGSDQRVASELPNEPCNIYDLTEGNDDDTVIDVDMHEDTKPIMQSDHLNTSTCLSHFAPSVVGNPSEINRNSATQVQGLSRLGPFETSVGQADYSTRTNMQPVGGASAPMLRHFAPPVFSDSVCLASRQTEHISVGTGQQSSLWTSVPSATNAMQLQQAPHQQMVSTGYGGNAILRNVSGVSSATQGLPVQMPRQSPMTSNRPAMSNLPGNNSTLNGLSGNTSSLPSRTSLRPTVPISASATVQQRQVLDSQLEQRSIAQMRGLTSHAQVPLNTFRPTSSLQAANQPRSTATPVQTPNNSFRPTSSPQVANQPRPTAAPVQTPNNGNNSFRPTSSPQVANQLRSTATPVQTPNSGNNSFRPTSSPQVANQPRSTTPLQVPNNAFRPASSPQAANQTRPTTQLLPQMVSTPPHLRSRTQIPAGGSINSSANRTPINVQHYRSISPSSGGAQLGSISRTRQLPTTPIQMQTSTAYLSSSVPGSGPPGRTVQTVSRTQDLVDVQSEQNWQPTGRMRGSLTGRAFSDGLNQMVIRPTQQTTPNPPGQSPNQVNNMPSPLQALLGNRNLHASSSSQPNPSQNNNNNNT